MSLPRRLLTDPIRPARRCLLLALLAFPVAAFDLESGAAISVSADSARLDDTQGLATYTGDVIITQSETRLSADRITLYRDNDGLNRIEASGSPARYHQPARDDVEEIEARAQRITYDARAGRLTFEQDAVIEQGDNLFSGNQIHYDAEERIVTAEGAGKEGGEGRVEMVIQPRSGKSSPRPTSPDAVNPEPTENGSNP